MHKCFKCGTEFEGDFCPECDTQWQEQKQCPKCNATLAWDVKFCSNCGYSFIERAENKPRKENKFLKWIKTHLKIVIPTAVVLAAVIVALALIPVYILASVNGTYYYSEAGELNDKTYVTLSTGKWKDSNGLEGKYSLSGSNITLTYVLEDDLEQLIAEKLGELFGQEIGSVIEFKGTVKNGILTFTAGRKGQYVSTKHKPEFGG